MRMQAGQTWARIAVAVAVACTRDPETQGQFAGADGGVDQGDTAGLSPDGEVEATAETKTVSDMAQEVLADAPPDVLAEVAADAMPEAMVDADEVPDTTPDIPAEVPDATPDLPEVPPDVPPGPDVPVDTPPDLPDLADTADPCAKAGACDDKNPCTQELCDPAKGCIYPPAKSGSPCADDGLTCTADLCDGLGTCVHKLAGCLIKGVCAAVGPNPANPCEKCIAGQKIWTGTSGACSDGDPCTVGDFCGGSGVCLPGAATNCDDGNACTMDSCDKGKGCVQVNGPDGKACAAGAGCTVGDQCLAGACVAGKGSKLFEVKVVGVGNTEAQAAAIVAGGYAVAGSTIMQDGYYDYWLARLDSAGQVSWQKTYGGGNADYAPAMAALPDGYAVVGHSGSKGAGNKDAWVVRTDVNGNLAWDKTFGGKEDDKAHAVVATPAGLVLGGYTETWGAGGADMWLVAVDSQGKELWQAQFGTEKAEYGYAVAIAESGYLLAGTALDSVGKTGVAYLVRTNASGQKQWEATYGSPLHSTSGAAVLALEGGFVLAGNRSPQVGGIEHGWLIRTDAGGKLLWEKTFGTTGNDEFRAMTKAGAGLAMAGGSKQAGAPGQAVWLLQVDALGNLQWEKTFAVAGIEGAIALALTPDGFLVAGYAKPLPPTTQAAKILRTDAFGNLTCATSGPCAGKPFGACDDANPCTADLCDAAHNGCWHADLPDKATCGAGKVCQGGKCL